MSRMLGFAVAALLVVAVGCARNQSGGGKNKSDSPASTQPDGRSLYERVGGEKGIAAVTKDFLDRLANDPRIDLERKNSAHPWEPTEANKKILEIRAIALMSKVTGGPDYYKDVGGRDMVTTHRGMNVTEQEWNAGVELFKQSLKAKRVGQREQDELLALVGGLKGQIVGK